MPDKEPGTALFDGDDIDTGEDAPEGKDFTDDELAAVLAAREAAGPQAADAEAS